MTSKPTILFLTNEEYGQASVHVTASSTLVQQKGDRAEVHLASFSKLAPRCPAGVTFHAIEGEGQMATFHKQQAERYPGRKYPAGVAFAHRPTWIESIRGVTGWGPLLLPWSPGEYVRIARDLEHLIEDLKPDLVLVDPLFGMGIDAARAKGVRAITLAPLSWDMCARSSSEDDNKDYALKWPSVGTGYPFPVPWYLVLPNTVHLLWIALWNFFLSPYLRRLTTARVEAGYAPQQPIFGCPTPMLCPGSRALDLPGNDTKKVIPFGPIVQAYPADYVERTDPNLADWLKDGGKGKTILIVLGSHFRLDGREALEMAVALKDVLEARPDMRVLWKLLPHPEHVEGGVKGELKAIAKALDGRIRVEDWLEVDPPALLQTGYVGLSVHHGGANSYHEAIGRVLFSLLSWPEVIIAGWSDCYDYAERATELGIGVWANKREAPSVAAPAIKDALLRVLGTDPSAPPTTYALKAADAALKSRLASAMPLVPGTKEELQAVKDARAAHTNGHAAEAVSPDTGSAREVYVQGRDVMAEWIFRLAASNVAPEAI